MNTSIEKLNKELNLDRLLKNGKTLQLEYNHQTDKIKVLICEMKRIDK